MKKENVRLFFAKDEYENIILINEINESNKDKEFTCPICGGIVKPRAITSDKVSSHFYHVNASDCSTESMLHWWYKNKYIISGDNVKIKFNNEEYEYICKDILIEKSYNTSFGLYTPDATVVTNNDNMIFIEYSNTNKKCIDEYINKWIELNATVIELDIKDLTGNKRKEFNAIMFDGVISNKNTCSKRYKTINKHIVDNDIKDRIRIKYLNGFLLDTYKYNNGDITIEEIAIILENMNKEDLKFIPKILSGLKCNNILQDYSDYKLDVVKHMWDNICIDTGVNKKLSNVIILKGFHKGATCGMKYDNHIEIYCGELYGHNNYRKIYEMLITKNDEINDFLVGISYQEKRRIGYVISNHIYEQRILLTENIVKWLRSINDNILNDIYSRFYGVIFSKFGFNKIIDFDDVLNDYHGINRKDVVLNHVKNELKEVYKFYSDNKIEEIKDIIKYLNCKANSMYLKQNDCLYRLELCFNAFKDCKDDDILKIDIVSNSHNKHRSIIHKTIEVSNGKIDTVDVLKNTRKLYVILNNELNILCKELEKQTKLWRF